MYLKLNGVEMECTGQEKWIELLERLPDGGVGALGVSVRGRTESLNAPVEEYAFAKTLTYADEEGRRIYERSLQLVFLTAAYRLYPGKRVRIRHSFAQGLYIDLPDVAVTEVIVADLKAEMQRIVAADLNDMVVNRRLREFIRVNEALQERKIQQIADQFIASGALILLIAGPSSSGKTTFAHRLSIALRVHGLRPVKVSLDDYYLDRDTLPREPDGSLDLERIDALDLDLLGDHLPRLVRGETVRTPEFDFKTGKRRAESYPFAVEQGQPIIIEGIHGLNDRLTATIPAHLKFKVYISPLTMLNLDDHNRIRTTDARLLRRIVRDNLFRGTPPEDTMAMWASVRRGEEKYIFPFQENADVMFNSALTYELAIMKKYAYPRLLTITEDSPCYTMARRLVKFLNYIQTADVEDEIPVNSILREFIGGCCFYKDED